jgi:acyl-CoA synthetase (AMP-forming)/AMP-acid ligase II
MTECSPVVSANCPKVSKAGTIGKPLSLLEVKIGDNSEIWVKGDSVFVGYHNDPVTNKRVFTEDGFFKTGDQGFFDSDDFLNFTGRIKDAFGEYASNPLEYIFYVKNGNKVGCMRSLENERSIAEGYDIYSSNMDKASKDELRDKCLQLLKTEGVPAQE